MSENRELLLLAAKAAGYQGDYVANGCDDRGQSCGIRLKLNINHIWNPLEEDDDALRLAVKLGLALVIGPGRTDAYCEGQRTSEYHDSDALQATRRAIVRAAAEIGKAMP